jgi:hypothetical protein
MLEAFVLTLLGVMAAQGRAAFGALGGKLIYDGVRELRP